jgi:hypothetical protein
MVRGYFCYNLIISIMKNFNSIFLTGIFLYLALSCNAQLMFGGGESIIGTVDLETANFQLISPPPPNQPFFNFSDIALTPDGRILALKQSNVPDGINETYLLEINTSNVLESDTLLVLPPFRRPSGLHCGPDHTVYISDYGIMTYNLLTEEFTDIGVNPNLRHANDIVWFEGALYGSTQPANGFSPTAASPPLLVKYDLDSIYINIIKTDTISGEMPFFYGLATAYDYENEKMRMIGSYSNPAPQYTSTDTSFFGEIFLTDTSYQDLFEIYIGSGRKVIYGLTSADGLRTNFTLQLDLDYNDSSNRFIDHYQVRDSLCTRSFRLADTDTRIRAPAEGVDSLIVVLGQAVHPPGQEYLTVQSTPGFEITGNTSTQIRVIPDDPTAIFDLEALVSTFRLEIEGVDLLPGERRVDFLLYSGSQVSDVSSAFIYPQPEVAPYPGEDITLDLCPTDNANLLGALGGGVYPNGYWSPELYQGGNTYFSLFNEPGVFQYIVAEGSCGPDTASITVTQEPPLVYNYDGAGVTLQVIYLCPGDTVQWAVDPTILDSWDWGGVPNPNAAEITITDEGYYDLFAEDINGCSYYYATRFKFPDWDGWDGEGPGMLMDTMTRCEGVTLAFFSQQASTDTVLCVTLPSTSDCDLTHCRTFIFTPDIEVSDTAAICTGEIYTWNDQSYTETGTYTQEIDGVNGDCDTLASLELTVHPNYERNIVVGLAPGSTYTVGDSVLTAAGLYSILLTSSQGCDSLINVEIEMASSLDDPLALACRIPTLLHKGQNDWQLNCTDAIIVRQMILYDAQGRIVYQQNGFYENFLLLTAVQQHLLSSGLYFYHLQYAYEGRILSTTGKLILLE